MPIQPSLCDRLAAVVGREHVLHRPVDLETYAYDCSFATRLQPYRPDLVVRPGAAAEVAAIVALAGAAGVPVTPRGAGSGQTGGAVAVKGGIVVDLLRLNRVLETDLPNLQVLIEPGVVHRRLDEHLAPRGFFFPPDPGSSQMCTLGGMVANNSSGMRAVKYGTTRNYVLGLEVVLPDGRLIWTGGHNSRALKSVTGYDLTSLFVGSEGTLGIITKIRLKVLPRPAARGVVLAGFAALDDTGQAVAAVFGCGLLPAAIEILDALAIRGILLIQPDAPLSPSYAAVLLFELDGSPAAVAEQAGAVARICTDLGAEVHASTEPTRAEQLLAARRLVGTAAARICPGASRVYDGEDISVPIACIPAALRRIQALAGEMDLPVMTYGHVGDGNLHAAVMADFRDQGALRRAAALAARLHELALELGGSVSAEHGVGLSRAAYVGREHGAALDVMRTVKQALDPRGLLNPGKMDL